MIPIRQETIRDYPGVYELVQAAFATAEHADGEEQDLVERLRKSDAFIPALSLVAEDEGRLAGFILFTQAGVGETTQLALAPLSVLPAYQRQGVGSALIRAGHEIAARLGYDFSIVLGSEAYYPRFGYVPASRFGIEAPFDVPDANFMAAPLREPVSDCPGTVAYAREFFLE